MRIDNLIRGLRIREDQRVVKRAAASAPVVGSESDAGQLQEDESARRAARDRDFVTALARGLEILRCFTPETPELGTTELARLTGMAQSTVWRLCHTLQVLGYLAPGVNPERLRVGLEVLTLGTSMTRAGVADAAFPAMTEIAQRFDMSLSLAGRSGTGMIIVQRAEAPGMLRLNFSVGTRLPMGRSAVGAAYLAATSAADRADALRALQAEDPKAWPQTRTWIERSIRLYETSGYVLNIRRLHPDICAVGIPLISRDRKAIMAINCGGPCSRVSEAMLTGPVYQALADLSRRLQPLLA